jgi:anti-anti-sigma factor
VVLELEGDLDLATVDVLRHELSAAIWSGVPLVVVDLDRLDFFGVVGLRPLVAAADRMAVRDRRLAVVGNQRPVRRLLIASGAHRRLPLHSSVASALSDRRQPSLRRDRRPPRSVATTATGATRIPVPAER